MTNLNNIKDDIEKKQNFADVTVETFAPEGQWASQIAAFLGKNTKINQLRKVFSEIKRIEINIKGKADSNDFQEERTGLYLMMPQLAYAQARKLIQREFYELIKIIIGSDGKTTKIKTVGDYRRFVQFITAIVAYHKQYSS